MGRKPNEPVWNADGHPARTKSRRKLWYGYALWRAERQDPRSKFGIDRTERGQPEFDERWFNAIMIALNVIVYRRGTEGPQRLHPRLESCKTQ